MNITNIVANFTELETKTLDAIRTLKAQGYGLIFHGDIEIEGANMKQIRGALANLSKKNALYIDNECGISLLIH